MNTTGSDLAA